MFGIGKIISRIPTGTSNKVAKGVSEIIPRVETSAKYLDSKGSIAQRQAVADDLCTKFSDTVSGIFQRKEELGMKSVITKKEINHVLKKLLPDVDVNVKSCNEKNARGAVVRWHNLEGAVKSYTMKLQFESFGKNAFIKSNDSANLNTMSHEIRHLINFATEPKYNARLDIKNMSAVKKNKAWSFYDNYLYADEAKHVNTKKDARIKSMETKIRAFFGFNEFSSAEKINQLQSWRHNLKTEMMAFKDGYSLDAIGTKEFVKRSIKGFEKGNDVKFDYLDEYGQTRNFNTKNYSELSEKVADLKAVLEDESKACYSIQVIKNYFMPEKTKIIERMLAEEINKVRVEQRKIYG